MGGIVIVGAGQAGASLAAKLRALGHAGPVTLIGEEPQPPYQRPPLSKAYLLGEMDLERLYLRAPAFWDEQAVTLRLGTPVEAIDTRARTVRLAGGETLSYDELALTTGSRPRRLPAAIGGDLANVFTVRTLADVDDMAPGFRKGARALIVGGGYIGLEAAAVAAKRSSARAPSTGLPYGPFIRRLKIASRTRSEVGRRCAAASPAPTSASFSPRRVPPTILT